MQELSPSIPFSWAWWSCDLGNARPCDSTYCQFPYDSLPPIPALDGTFNWLGQPGWLVSLDESADQRAQRQRRTDEARTRVQELVTQAEQLGLMLPRSFIRLMAAPELYSRIPEFASSWFNLNEAQLDPCPGSSDGFAVRFLNDQQDCILWYLYVTQQGTEAVLAISDPYPYAPSNYLERVSRPDEDGPLTDKQREAVIANISACAPSFEAFVYRWWLEGTIYMKLNGFNNTPLSEAERHYLSHYQQGLLTR